MTRAANRNPRLKKLANFRRRGHCRRANCGICHPDKRWHRSERRARAKAEIRNVATEA